MPLLTLLYSHCTSVVPRLSVMAKMVGRDRGSGYHQQYEFLLFGSVSEGDVKALLHRLRGLCDFATTGGVAFTDREITYKIGDSVFISGRG